MQESNFQFKNPILTKLNYELNDNFDKNDFDDKIRTKLNIAIKGKISEKQVIATLLGQIGEIDKNLPFYIEIEISAPFRWTEDISEDTLNKLLKRNGAALLLSYMRPIVAFVTGQSGIVPYNIPYIDFTKEEE